MIENAWRVWTIGAILLSATAQALALPFPTATVERQVLMQERVLDGQVEAIQRSTVSAQTSGRVVEIFFDVDDFVEQGQLVVRLSDSEQRSRLQQAQASLDEANARRSEASTEFDRIRRLHESDLISRAEFDRSRTALDSAEARLNSARAAVAEAREQLGYTQVTAPYPGIVTERHVEIGESVGPGAPLLTGISLERLRVELHVPQGLIETVRRLQNITITLPSGDRIQAESLTIFPFADPQTNTFRVRAILPELAPAAGLFPGMLVKAAIRLGSDQRLVVPSEAVVFRSEVVAVYVIEADGRIGFRQIRVGRELSEGFEVLAGLRPGERVALDPVHAGIYLKESQLVTP